MAKLNHVVLIIDRSGSMAPIAESMNDKIKDWVKEQKDKAPQGTLFTAVLFDDKYDVVYDRAQIDTIDSKDLFLMPRGSTALNDAIMKALANIKDEDALVMVVTDGQENASKEVTFNEVLARLADLEKQGCALVFMSSSMSAQKDAAKYKSTTTISTRHTSADSSVTADMMTANTQSYYTRGMSTAAQSANMVGSVDTQTLDPSGVGDALTTAARKIKLVKDKLTDSVDFSKGSASGCSTIDIAKRNLERMQDEQTVNTTLDNS